MAVEEDGELEGEDKVNQEHKGEGTDDDEVKELLVLSLHSMAGFTSGRSMRLKGDIAGQEIIILIDSGATTSSPKKWQGVVG